MTIPSDISGLVSWFKADAITSLSDGDAVASWTDSSSTNNATQATSANQPLYKTSIVNSLPVVRFADTTDELAVASAGTYTGTTMLAVVRPPFTSGDYAIRRHFENGGIEWRVTGGVIGLDKRGQANIINGSTTMSTSGFSVVALTSDSTANTHLLYLNGTLDGSRIAGENVGSDGAYTIGNTNTAGNFDIAELIIYNVALSDTDRDAITSYLGTKYAITVSGGGGGGSTDGALAGSLGALTMGGSFAGTITSTGALAGSLGALTTGGSFAGTITSTGALAGSLGALTTGGNFAGTITSTGALAGSLPALAGLSGSFVAAGPPISGVLVGALPALAALGGRWTTIPRTQHIYSGTPVDLVELLRSGTPVDLVVPLYSGTSVNLVPSLYSGAPVIG